MAIPDVLLSAIEAVYGAGFDELLWPNALAKITLAVGGIAGTLEVFERQDAGLAEFHSHGLPPENEVAYLHQYFSLNPRIPVLLTGKPGDIVGDYSILDERAMDRDPFYDGFLAPTGYRYFIGAVFEVAAHNAFLFSVQRAAKQGHVGEEEVRNMQILLPHVRQAFDMTKRLRGGGSVNRSFKDALDWLDDGVALLRADGFVLHANEAFQALIRRGDGISLRSGRMEIADPTSRAHFDKAIGAIVRAGFDASSSDIPVPRKVDNPPYIVSVRPLVPAALERHGSQAGIIVFIRDPTRHNAVSASVLRDLFGFTEAEADLACALQAGVTPGAYAQARVVSLNTVYTHLRRIKGKARCSRMSELIRKLNDCHMRLRSDRSK